MVAMICFKLDLAPAERIDRIVIVICPWNERQGHDYIVGSPEFAVRPSKTMGGRHSSEIPSKPSVRIVRQPCRQ